FKLLKIPSILVLMIAALIISLIHQVYFVQTGTFLTSRGLPESMIGATMTIGQGAEILVMAVLGLLLAKFGFKWVLVLGGLGFVGKYAIFAIPDVSLAASIAAIAFHGLCYACFFAASFMYIDRVAAKDIRHSA